MLGRQPVGQFTDISLHNFCQQLGWPGSSLPPGEENVDKRWASHHTARHGIKRRRSLTKNNASQGQPENNNTTSLKNRILIRYACWEVLGLTIEPLEITFNFAIITLNISCSNLVHHECFAVR